MLNRRELIVIASVFIVFFMFASMLTSGVDKDNAESDNPYFRSNTPDPSSVSGIFYGQIEYRDEIHSPSLFQAWVRVHPSDGWPEVELHDNISEASIHTWIQIRGLSIPQMNAYRARPHAEVRRERSRFDASISFLWHLVQAGEYIILESPELVATDGSDKPIVFCNVYIELAGTRIDLSKALVENGHAMYNNQDTIDWGHRDIR